MSGRTADAVVGDLPGPSIPVATTRRRPHRRCRHRRRRIHRTVDGAVLARRRSRPARRRRRASPRRVRCQRTQRRVVLGAAAGQPHQPRQPPRADGDDRLAAGDDRHGRPRRRVRRAQRRGRPRHRSSTRAARSPWPATRRSIAGSRRRSPKHGGSGSAMPTSACSTPPRRTSGSAPPSYSAAMFTPHCAAVHPLRLVHAIAAAATRAGARIVEGTSTSSRSSPDRLTTTAGTIRADVVVLATEAYTSQLPRATSRRPADLLDDDRLGAAERGAVGRDRARRPADVHRRIARRRLRPAHGRRAPRLRRTRRAVPLRIAGRGRFDTDERVRSALRDDGRRDVPGARRRRLPVPLGRAARRAA